MGRWTIGSTVFGTFTRCQSQTKRSSILIQISLLTFTPLIHKARCYVSRLNNFFRIYCSLRNTPIAPVGDAPSDKSHETSNMTCLVPRQLHKPGIQDLKKYTVPTKRLGTPPFFQCVLMALRVLGKR